MKAPDAFRTISEVAEDLDLPQHVLRFWETRFNQIKPMKRGGGRRYYRPEDIDLLRGIRILLYSEGFTIRGVQRLLKENGVAFVAGVGHSGSVQTVTAERGEAAAPPISRPRAGPPLAETQSDEPSRVAENDQPRPSQASPREVPAGPPPTPPLLRAPAGAITLTMESRRRIEAALSDLLEAQRLLDQAR